MSAEEILKVIKQMNEQHQQQMQQQQQQINLLQQQVNNRRDGAEVGVPVETTHDQRAKNLADQMVTFSYDPDNNLTFESWYGRYTTVFTVDIAGWTDAEKIRLLLTKFPQSDYQKFAELLMPQSPTDLTLEAVIVKLKTMFGFRESKFMMRHKCFSLKKDDSESFIDYSARINKQGEKFDVTHCTADDFKVLLFVSGLKSTHDSTILEKLLSKIDAQHKRVEAAADQAARDAIHKLTLQDLVNEAERILSLKQDKSLVGQPASSSTPEVFAVQRDFQSKNKSNKTTSSQPRKPPGPCRYCGGDHWEKECDMKEHTCSACHVTGHKVGFCASAHEATRKALARAVRSGNNCHQVRKAQAARRKFIVPQINGTKLKLQLDSASDVTIISIDNWRKLGVPALTPCQSTPTSASGDPIPLKGSFKCTMALNNVKATGICYVSKSLNLLGTDWIESLGIWNVPIASICQKVTMQCSQVNLKEEAEKKFPTLFADGLGLCTKTKVSLTLKESAKPIFRKARNVPFAAIKLVEAEIKRQEQLGIYSPVAYSEFAAPIVVVKKKNGKLRICGDYSTGLNDALEPNKFPLPTIEQILTQLAGKKFFSKIDLSDAFLQLELDDEAKKLLTINTPLGLFQVNRMQPGVKTAPGAFQELMCKMLCGISGTFAFIDDIIVSGSSEKEHKQQLFKVLERIQEFGFRLRIEKCDFGKAEILFCGHIINDQGIRPDPEKITSIQAIPRPTDLTRLRSFLGAVNYYGKFVKAMKDLRAPLDDLTKNDVDFVWKPQHEESFEKLKKVMASDLVLTHYDPQKKIVVASDSSSYGKGGTVMHQFPDGSLHPIVHFSSSLTPAEKNYSQIEREACAADFVLKRARPYIYGRKFEFHIDHKPLLAIFGSKKGIPAHSASRLQRYALNMLGYEFDIKYVNTDSFGYADVVSRLISRQSTDREDTVVAAIQAGEEDEQCFAVETANTLPVKFEDIQAATRKCPVLKQVSGYIAGSWPRTKKQIGDPEVAKFYDQQQNLTIIENCIFFGDRVVVPKVFRRKILRELHEGHPGIVRTKLLARSKVFWPKIDADIERMVKECDCCATAGKAPIKCTLKSWPISTKPWSRIHADYAGPIEGVFFLVVVDSFSKWPEVYKTTSTTSTKTIELLMNAFAQHGLPDTLVTDNGTQFTSREFASFCQGNGIDHVRSAPYHPQSNGQAEKFVDLLKTGLAKAVGTIDQRLQEFLTGYRSTPSYTLDGKTPSELLNNRSMKKKIDLCKPNTQHYLQRNLSMESKFNKAHGARFKEFEVGNTVYYQLHKANKDWEWVPAIITGRFGTVNYSITTETGRVIANVHSNQLKTRHSNDFHDLSDNFDEDIEQDADPQVQNPNDSADNIEIDEEDEEVFEDAYNEELHPPELAGPRRTTRINSGVPPQRYQAGDD